jgi:hypothetical protein
MSGDGYQSLLALSVASSAGMVKRIVICALSLAASLALSQASSLALNRLT